MCLRSVTFHWKTDSGDGKAILGPFLWKIPFDAGIVQGLSESRSIFHILDDKIDCWWWRRGASKVSMFQRVGVAMCRR